MDGYRNYLIEKIDRSNADTDLFLSGFEETEEERLRFIIKNPKQRYFDLLKNNKQVISRVPQHQVASFIGISAEHLSRIHKEISDSE